MSALVRKRILMVALAAACAWLGFVSVRATIRRGWASGQLGQIEGAMTDQQRANDRLAAQLTRMRAPAWLALIARAQLNYKMPDEQVVFVYKSQKADIIIQPQSAAVPPPDWHRWVDWVRGK